ncbi:MAG: hypothetical protein QNL61_07050 [Crocinitomicaceae bacterium]
MLDKGTDFPQYRKLSNDKVFYRILDYRHFDEIQIIGTKAQLRNVVAEQYPEILRIQDMLSYGIPGFVASNEEEFLNIKGNCIFI